MTSSNGVESSYRSQRAEIAEAIEAADNALDHLRAADDALDSAGRWGLFDMFAGGMITSMVKHGKLNDAQSEIEAARDAVRHLARELEDVDGSQGLNVDMGGFLTFADIFFDNMFVDMMVQSKISQTKAELARAIGQIEALRAHLSRLLRP